MSYNQVPSQDSMADAPPVYQQNEPGSEQEQQQQQQEEQKSSLPVPPPYQQQPMMQYQGMPMGVVPGGMIQARPPMLPRDMQPNDFMVVSVVTIITLGIFNVTSLLFTVPALICSVLAYDKRNMGKYTSARRLGRAAIIMNLIAITWVMMWGVIITGISVAIHRGVGEFSYY